MFAIVTNVVEQRSRPHPIDRSRVWGRHPNIRFDVIGDLSPRVHA